MFVHFSALPQTGGYRSLSEGQRVQFEIVQERGRERAANVVTLLSLEHRTDTWANQKSQELREQSRVLAVTGEVLR